jgi:hypothetical protein
MLNSSRRFAAALTMLFLLAIASLATAADIPTVNWSQLHPATSPTGRAYPAAAYDPVSKKVVLFGGFSATGYLNDTWTFDGTNWSKVNTSTAPPVRTNATMAFDKVSKKLVMFGGYNGSNYLADTWLYDGSTSTWTNANPSTAPVAVTGPMLFTDPANGHADVYGGFDGRFYQSTTYQWTGTDWTNLNPPTSAYARSIAVVGLDGATKSVVLFDGLGDLNPYNTWTFDGTTWTMQSPATQPPSRYGAGAAYDPALKAVITFSGGEGGVDILTDTWAWTPAGNWVQLTTAQTPPAREGFCMVWDSAIGHVVIFGGQLEASFLSDTWELTPH